MMVLLALVNCKLQPENVSPVIVMLLLLLICMFDPYLEYVEHKIVTLAVLDNGLNSMSRAR